MKLFKNLSKRAKLVVASTVLVLAAAALVPAITKAGFGPDRPTKVYSDGVAGFDHVTFDSFTNVPNIGDERQFFNGTYPDGKVFSDPMPEVKDGDVLTLEVYVHNGADPSLNDSGVGIAKNTKVKVSLPTGIAKTQEATAYISADNAQPQTVTDTMNFGAANGGNFSLAYVPGSAHIQGNYINASLPDSIVGDGAAIGTDALDGKLKGCFQQMVYVTLQVKVSMPEYKITKQVKVINKTTAWAKTDNVVAGDTASWLVTFENNGHTPLHSVVVTDQVPAGLTVVPGTVKLTNGNYLNGYTFPDSAIMDNGRMVSVNIGDYNPGGIAYVTYRTTVDKPGADVCSDETLTNKAFATPEGMGAIFDTASVTVPGNKCEQPKTPTYACTLLHIVADNATRTVTVDKFQTSQANGAAFKQAVLNWGDQSAALTTNNVKGQTHQYAADGTYKVSVTAHFTVNGDGDKSATSESCAQTVTFTSTPPELPNTGAGNVIGIVFGAIVAGTIGYRLFLSRKLARR